jgi:hypothetical protein
VRRQLNTQIAQHRNSLLEFLSFGMLFVAIVFGGGFLLAAQVAPTLISFRKPSRAATKQQQTQQNR